MSEGKKTYPNRDARSHNEPIRLEKIEKDVHELKNQVEEINKEIDVLKTAADDELMNLPESIEPHAARAEGEDDEDETEHDPQMNAGEDDEDETEHDPARKQERRGLWAAIVRIFKKLRKRIKWLAAGEDDEDETEHDPQMSAGEDDEDETEYDPG